MKFRLLWRGQFQGLLSLLASDSEDKLPLQIIRLMPGKNWGWFVQYFLIKRKKAIIFYL